MTSEWIENNLCQKLIRMSFAKIVGSKGERGGARLHKNLLILHVLQRARTEHTVDEIVTKSETKAAAADTPTESDCASEEEQPPNQTTSEETDINDSDCESCDEQSTPSSPAPSNTNTETTNSAPASTVKTSSPQSASRKRKCSAAGRATRSSKRHAVCGLITVLQSLSHKSVSEPAGSDQHKPHDLTEQCRSPELHNSVPSLTACSS